MAAVKGGGAHRFNNNLIYPSPPPPVRSHLLELTIMSAQDIHPVSHRMCTYASAWIDPGHKLKTHADTVGRANPNWNDKFVFRVDAPFLRSDTSSFTIDIYARARLRKDRLVGTARVILSTLRPTATTRSVALQVRRPKSLRPQGIINVGVTLLDEYLNIRSMPVDSAFVLKDMMNTGMKGKMLSRISSAIDESEEGDNESHEEWKLERNLSVEVGRKAVEQEAEALESKLEKWRIDLSPGHDMNKSKKKVKKLTSCFCGSQVKE